MRMESTIVPWPRILGEDIYSSRCWAIGCFRKTLLWILNVALSVTLNATLYVPTAGLGLSSVKPVSTTSPSPEH